MKSYCKEWNYVTAKPIDAISEERARSRDAEGSQYAVLFHTSSGDVERSLTIVWQNEYIGVDFLDEVGRPVLHYSFQVIRNNWMFLSQVTIHEWGQSGRWLSDSLSFETYHYKQDGTVAREVADQRAKRVARETRVDVPVDVHWEPVPEFGDWASIARYDRSLPVDQQPPGRPWV